MVRKGGRVVLGAVTVLVVCCVAVATAASQFAPSLQVPNGKKVHAGAITLRVKAADAKQVAVWVRPKRVIKHGQLGECTNVNKGCGVFEMHKWSGHAGWWTYKATAFHFKGWWSTTAGGYYWQAESFAKAPPCVYVTDGDCTFLSSIGHFKVR